MKFHKNKFLTTVSAIALVLAVGACSSSGDDETMMNGAAMNGDDAAMNGDDAATNGDGDATNGDDAATNGGDDAKTPAQILATAEAALADLPADATDDVRAAAMTALEAALMLAGNEAEYLAYLEKKVDDQAQAIKDEDAADAAKEASDKAAEVLKALTALAGTAPGITVSASSGGDLTAKAAGYTMSSTTPEAISGFRGAILTKDRAEARVYTSIGDAVATAIGGIYQSSSRPGQPDVYGVFEMVTEETNIDGIPWSVVKRTDDKSATTGAGGTAKTTFAGSVRGLAGTFSCTGNDCTPPVPVAGVVTSIQMWTFVPTVTDGKIDVADKDGYLQFGWWLNMLGKDVEDGFEVQTFASATDYAEIDTALSGETVTGSATYTGGAAGKWAIASTTEDTTDGGHFTATATLGVDFDANNAADDQPADKFGVSVSGTINKFMTGNVSRPNWTVTLTVQPAPNLPTTSEGVTGASKWTTGGAVDGIGTWEASFYGREKVTTHPTAVEGTFNAAIADGAVGQIQGAFGATN